MEQQGDESRHSSPYFQVISVWYGREHWLTWLICWYPSILLISPDSRQALLTLLSLLSLFSFRLPK